ncbi:MAG: 2OG-Fe(II) oxygenase [Acidobacteria bacterium]|nr:2OG-Fe(II) oxygenase [Acidobacteriota bacterium]
MLQVCAQPRLYIQDHFLTVTEIRYVLHLTSDAAALAAGGVTLSDGPAGRRAELPVPSDPVLKAISKRLDGVTGLVNRRARSFRFRHYGPGNAHPAHFDNFQAGDYHLIATAMMYLSDCTLGGETSFPDAEPDALALEPRAGRLVLWFNHLTDGSPDTHAYHEAWEVLQGEKITLTEFYFSTLSDCALAPPFVTVMR